jgi:hypothetical protein
MKTNPMDVVLGNLLIARNVAHMWHWKVRSLSLHLALGELYDGLGDFLDELAEIYMGKYGTDGHIPLSDPNPFSEEDVGEFIRQLTAYLEFAHEIIPQDGFIVNKFEELQAAVSKIKYKVENLTEAKKPTPLHLLPKAHSKERGKPRVFDQRKVDFSAAVEANFGRLKPQRDGTKRYYVRLGQVVAEYDDLDDYGVIYV